MKTIDLNLFLPLIQLAAGLNVAYVAVGISQGYTRILLDNIFNVKSRISNKFDPIRSNISINRKTLDTMTPSNVDGKNTNDVIEGLKREYEKLTERINTAEDSIEKEANNTCEFRCFSGLSLMMFLYCCAILFIAPFDCVQILLCFTSLVFCHSVLGWICERHKIVCSLTWIIVEFAIFLILSIACYFVCNYCNFQPSIFCRNTIVIVSALLPLINFVTFFIKSLYKMRRIVNKIEEQSNEIAKENSLINTKFEQLQSLEQLKMAI